MIMIPVHHIQVSSMWKHITRRPMIFVGLAPWFFTCELREAQLLASRIIYEPLRGFTCLKESDDELTLPIVGHDLISVHHILHWQHITRMPMILLTTNTMTILRPHQLVRAALQYCYIFVWYIYSKIKDQSQDSIMHTIQLLQVCRDSYVAAIVIRTPKSGKRVCCQTALASDALLKTYNTWNIKNQGAMCTKYRKLLESYQKVMDRISIKLRIIQYLRNQRVKQSLE